jgi:hypothetical protein
VAPTLQRGSGWFSGSESFSGVWWFPRTYAWRGRGHEGVWQRGATAETRGKLAAALTRGGNGAAGAWRSGTVCPHIGTHTTGGGQNGLLGGVSARARGNHHAGYQWRTSRKAEVAGAPWGLHGRAVTLSFAAVRAGEVRMPRGVANGAARPK